MLSHEDNERLVRVGTGTPLGELFRLYWIPFLPSAELTPAGSLTMSGLTLGVSRSAGFQHRLLFSTEASALAHLELYGGVAGTPVGAVFEVSETTDGPAMFRVPGTISPTADEDRFSVTGAISIGLLPPGDYVIRAIVGAQGKPSGRVLRTLHKIG